MHILKKSVMLSRLLLLGMFSLAGYMAWDYQSKLFENKGRLTTYQSSLVPDAIELSWNSEVKVPMARRMSEAFSNWKSKTDKFVITLHSPGGSLLEGQNVIEVIEYMKKTHKVVTYVGARRSCLSMCVPIYLHGDVRIAAATSRWMFHEPKNVDFFTDKEIQQPDFERQRMINRFVERYFTTPPINAGWRDRLLQFWKGKDVWRTGQHLVKENSGIITDLR